MSLVENVIFGGYHSNCVENMKLLNRNESIHFITKKCVIALTLLIFPIIFEFVFISFRFSALKAQNAKQTS